MRTRNQIQAEIKKRLGFFPPFFEPALETPEVLKNLWQQTLSAYLNNPLPLLFKEKIFAYLSRYCAIPYCVICHSCMLRPLGLSPQAVLQLLEAAPPDEGELQGHLSFLATQAPLNDWPAADSSLEQSIFSCAIHVFLSSDLTHECRQALRRVLSASTYQHLTSFLAYIKTCHMWVEAHPEILYDLDQRAQKYLPSLLKEAGLHEFFHDYPQRVKQELQVREQQLLAEVRHRKQIEAALRDANQMLTTLIEAAPLAIIGLDLEGNIKLWNRSAKDLFGWPDQEQALESQTLTLSNEQQLEFNILQTSVQQGRVLTGLELHRQQPDGTQISMSISAGPIYDAAGQITGAIGVIADITQQKQAQALLEQLSHQHQLLLQSVGEGIYGLDHQGRVTFANPATTRMVGWKADQLIGQSMHSIVHHSRLDGTPNPESDCQIYATIRDGIIRQGIEDIFWRRDGTSFSVEYTSTPIYEQNELVGAVVLFKDITERKQAELHLRQQADRDRLLGDIALRIRRSLSLADILQTTVAEVRHFLQVERVAIYELTPDIYGKFTVESVAEECTSILEVDLQDPCFEQKYAHLYQQGRISAVDDIYQANFPDCYLSLLERGQIRANLIVPIISNDQLWGMLCAHQCSEPRSWQAFEIDALQKLVTQLAIAIQQSELYEQVQRLNSDLEQQVAERTAQLRQALGFEAMLKRITDKVRDSLDEGQILQTAVRELALVLGLCCCDAALYDLDAQTATICYEYSPSAKSCQGLVISMNDFPVVFQQSLQGQSFQFCRLNPKFHRGRAAILTCPIFDNQGVLGDLALFRAGNALFQELEITLAQQVANHCAIAIRQARLYQTAQTQISELEKLSHLKDDFLSTVSHELRTPVSNMKMAIHMLKLAPTRDRQERYLEILQTECQRETELINDLLDLQRLEAASYPVFLVESIDLQHWLPMIMAPFYDRTSKRQQTLQLQLSADVPPLLSDRASLERIFAELLNNACKYTPTEGTIRVEVSHTLKTAREPQSVMRFAIANEQEIPAAELPRIFEKFYRVPNADPWKQGGTGLGLALVQRLVERLNGTITVDSAAGWTTFALQFPLQANLSAAED